MEVSRLTSRRSGRGKRQQPKVKVIKVKPWDPKALLEDLCYIPDCDGKCGHWHML